MTAMGPPVLMSVNVGLPRNVPWQGKTVYTGVADGEVLICCAQPSTGIVLDMRQAP